METTKLRRFAQYARRTLMELVETRCNLSCRLKAQRAEKVPQQSKSSKRPSSNQAKIK